MKVVIPVGRGRPTTLRYVIRSLRLYAGVTEVITVGERPEGIEPDLHLDSPNQSKPHLNVAGHLRKAAERFDVFIWCDDDTFTVRPWVPGVYVREFSIAQMLRYHPSRGNWSHAVRQSIKVMESQGHDPEQVPAGPTHRPWLVESKRVLKTLDVLDGGSFKALYVAGLEGTIPSSDPKVIGKGLPHPDADVISVYSDSWRWNAGRILRERFSEPTRWETDDIPDLRRGPRRYRRVARR